MNNGQNKVVCCPHFFVYSDSQETPTGLAGVGKERELQHCRGLSMAPPAPNRCCFPGVKLQHPQEQAENFSLIFFLNFSKPPLLVQAAQDSGERPIPAPWRDGWRMIHHRWDSPVLGVCPRREHTGGVQLSVLFTQKKKKTHPVVCQ